MYAFEGILTNHECAGLAYMHDGARKKSSYFLGLEYSIYLWDLAYLRDGARVYAQVL